MQRLSVWEDLCDDTDAFGATVAKEQRHSHLDIFWSYQEAKETRTSLVGTEKFSAKYSFDHRRLSNAPDVNGVLKSFLDSFDTWVLNDNNCCL